MQDKVAVIGAGGWGTALAIVANVANNRVTLWARNQEKAEAIAETRENKEYLPGIAIPETITVTSDLETTLTQTQLVLFVVPSQALRANLKAAAPYLTNKQCLITACKGIEDKTQMRMSQVVQDVLPEQLHQRIGVISGPNHAEEVGRQIPSATVISSLNAAVAERSQALLMSQCFRVYTTNDLVGVEVAGAMKNVIALAAGISDGLGFGDNTKAALMTRGLAEMARLGVAMGAEPLTFSGLAGMGDLIATCTSLHSRNARAGRAIGSGQKLSEILAASNMVVEGVWTTEAAYRLGETYNTELPITNQVYQILFHDKSPRKAVIELMERGAAREDESYLLSAYALRG